MTMGAAYRVKYCEATRGSECPDAVVIFHSGAGEDVGQLAIQIKEVLENARGIDSDFRVTISSIVYIGPWFRGKIRSTEKK